jgi:hypothetical protein
MSALPPPEVNTNSAEFALYLILKDLPDGIDSFQSQGTEAAKQAVTKSSADFERQPCAPPSVFPGVALELTVGRLLAPQTAQSTLPVRSRLTIEFRPFQVGRRGLPVR